MHTCKLMIVYMQGYDTRDYRGDLLINYKIWPRVKMDCTLAVRLIKARLSRLLWNEVKLT